MYITGGIGSTSAGEAFTIPYDLPNLVAYSESCAAIGLALFANSMLKLDIDSKYSDTVERILYNGFMSAISLDGTMFFYENPMGIIPTLSSRDRFLTKAPNPYPPAIRSKVFSTSCCPPNIVRFIPSAMQKENSFHMCSVYKRKQPINSHGCFSVHKKGAKKYVHFPPLFVSLCTNKQKTSIL